MQFSQWKVVLCMNTKDNLQLHNAKQKTPEKGMWGEREGWMFGLGGEGGGGIEHHILNGLLVLVFTSWFGVCGCWSWLMPA